MSNALIPCMRRRFVLAALSTVAARHAFAAAPVAQALQPVLQIAVSADEGLGGVALGVLRQAYARLDVALITRTLPLRRSLQATDAGDVDGDVMHSEAAIQEWPKLIRIKVPIARASIAAYRRGAGCPARITRQSLDGQRVAYLRGTRIIETALPAARLQAVSDNLEALRQVQDGMADVALCGDIEGDALLLKHHLAGKLCRVAEPVVTAELYHSLNPRHAVLARRVEQLLGEWQASGELARMWAAEARRAHEAILAGP